MNISAFPKHLFWSYKPNADLPVGLVAEQVMLYGDLDDLFHLADLVPLEVIAQLNKKIDSSGHWKKRTHFIDKVILG